VFSYEADKSFIYFNNANQLYQCKRHTHPEYEIEYIIIKSVHENKITGSKAKLMKLSTKTNSTEPY
jgi:hypothetical protein